MILWLVRHREAALENWAAQRRLAVWLQGSPAGLDIAFAARRARRVLRFWDALLDAATWRARRREAGDE